MLTLKDAVKSGDLEKVKQAIESEERTRKSNDYSYFRHFKEDTPLHHASYYHRFEIAQNLVGKGEYLEAKNRI